MSKSRSVIVCGGGIVGLCAAHYLARAGFDVTLLERNAEGADSCACGSAGYISPSHLAPISAPGMVWQGLINPYPCVPSNSIIQFPIS